MGDMRSPACPCCVSVRNPKIIRAERFTTAPLHSEYYRVKWHGVRMLLLVFQ